MGLFNVFSRRRTGDSTPVENCDSRARSGPLGRRVLPRKWQRAEDLLKGSKADLISPRCPDLSMSSLPSDRYRSDVDGLRAVAVMLVVNFHGFPEVMRGGFIGVDIGEGCAVQRRRLP